MHKEKRASRKFSAIHIEPYLAEYLNGKYGRNTITDAVKIPYNTDLYHCIWELMSRQRINQSPPDDANLRIDLPCRKAGDGVAWKDPTYYNYLSSCAAKAIENQIRRMFNFELHRVLLENEEFGHPYRNIDVIYDFMRSYRLKSISSDALLKNYYRFRHRLRPKKIRAYKKNIRN